MTNYCYCCYSPSYCSKWTLSEAPKVLPGDKGVNTPSEAVWLETSSLTRNPTCQLCGQLRMSSSSSLALELWQGALWWLLLHKPFISNAHRDAGQTHWDGEPPLIPLYENGTEDRITTRGVFKPGQGHFSHNNPRTHSTLPTMQKCKNTQHEIPHHCSSGPNVFTIFPGQR